MDPLAVAPRTHGATAARRIPDPKVGGSNPSGFSSFLRFHKVAFCFHACNPLASALPPELRWQSGRLLTDRSLVRSQVVACYFFRATKPFFEPTRSLATFQASMA